MKKHEMEHFCLVHSGHIWARAVVTLSFMYLICLLFNHISTFSGYLMPNLFFFFPSFRRTVVVLFNPWMGRKGVYTFPKGICLKVNVIAQLEFELVYYDPIVQHFNHYAMGTPFYVFEGIPIIQKMLVFNWNDNLT